MRNVAHIAGDTGSVLAVTPDLLCLQLSLVNVFYYGEPGTDGRGWVLIDAGLGTSYHKIVEVAEDVFGPDNPPDAIILTHGHFDHVGSLRRLVGRWRAPVYAHRLELPYLTGESDYPPPDPTVGGGAMAYMAPLYPRRAIDLGENVHPLPEDGTVPGMPGWRWIHTPGHTPGHVALFREEDRALIAGDAFVTQRQESLLGVMTRSPHVRRPPAYFTIDWEAARRSVEELARLQPSVAATGHGLPMHGWKMRRQLDELARRFDDYVPNRGRYVETPAVADRHGIVAVPPPAGRGPLPLVLAGLGAAAAFGLARRRQRHAW
jgi:glyoxylase-like metal-dependent hydrolase (beta-lactamase superfamily II)